MPETIESPQAQPAKVELSGLDRLSRDFEEIFPENKTPEPEKAPETPVSATEETAKLEGEEEKEAPVTTEEPAKAEEPAKGEEGFEEVAATEEETGWKPLIKAFGYEVPQDFSEEKGFEVLSQLKEAEFNTRLEEVKNFRETELFSELPEDVRDEAKLTFELFKAGQTLEQINAPMQQIKEWKAMSKEELIRHNLEGIPGYTLEMIDHRMTQIQEGNHVDIEYQILKNYVNQKEAELVQQKQQQIQINNNQQAHIREQRQLQELNSFKAALDKVPTFMEKKLSAENKNSIVTDFNNGYAKALLQNPEKLAKFMLYDKYGEQGLKYLQSRAIEQATLEKAKGQLNIPPVTGGPANRTETTTQVKNGIDRLAQDPRFA